MDYSFHNFFDEVAKHFFQQRIKAFENHTVSLKLSWSPTRATPTTWTEFFAVSTNQFVSNSGVEEIEWCYRSAWNVSCHIHQIRRTGTSIFSIRRGLSFTTPWLMSLWPSMLSINATSTIHRENCSWFIQLLIYPGARAPSVYCKQCYTSIVARLHLRERGPLVQPNGGATTATNLAILELTFSNRIAFPVTLIILPRRILRGPRCFFWIPTLNWIKKLYLIQKHQSPALHQKSRKTRTKL